MKILVAGSSGMVGSAVTADLRAHGHSVAPMVRPPQMPGPGQAFWNPATGELSGAEIVGADAVVNLAGASVAAARWSDRRKELLRSSRVDATRNLIAGLARLELPPRIFVSASAIGYYGDRADEQLTEDSSPGNGFLAQLVRDWETETESAERLGMRTTILRFGIILSARGGALAQMLGPFRMGLGGRLGSGGQWMSWIALDDAVQVVREALENPAWHGVYNVVAPEPVTNADFTRALGRVLFRPTLFAVPRFALQAMFGEMADAMLLASQRVEPKRLAAAGYSYLFPRIEAALRATLSGS